MFSYIIKRLFLHNFFQIDLTSDQQNIANDTIRRKYIPATRNGVFYALLAFPAILLLDTSVVVSVLIPITLVAGTAWFAISIANLKKKFERFGVELTRDLFEGFVISLFLLFLITLVALNQDIFSFLQRLNSLKIFRIIAGVLGMIVVGRAILKIYLGAMKYDINDAMLAGQTEVAERFFKKSLSMLYAASERLRSGRSLQVANYYIGVCFYELYFYLVHIEIIEKTQLDDDIKKLALELKSNPSMSQEEADMKSHNLIRHFLSFCSNITDEKVKNSYENVKNELEKIEKNRFEDQHMIDTRFATIFEEIADMLEIQGRTLFEEPGKKRDGR